MTEESIIKTAKRARAKVSERFLASNPIQAVTEIDFTEDQLADFYLLLVLGGKDPKYADSYPVEYHLYHEIEKLKETEHFRGNLLEIARGAGGAEWSVPALRNAQNTSDTGVNRNTVLISFKNESLLLNLAAKIRADMLEISKNLPPHPNQEIGRLYGPLSERDTLLKQVYERQEILLQCLEVIAVGDSKSPIHDAAEALIECGHWSAMPEDLQRDISNLHSRACRE